MDDGGYPRTKSVNLNFVFVNGHFKLSESSVPDIVGTWHRASASDPEIAPDQPIGRKPGYSGI